MLVFLLTMVLTGDDAFGLTDYLMKPYPQSGLDINKIIYNYRLSRMRRISENGFGIIGNRWRLFRAPILLEPDKVIKITLAALTLHNFLRPDIPSSLIDLEDPVTREITPGQWRSEPSPSSWLDITPHCGNNYTTNAKKIREEFTEYFNNEGVVSWQWRQCGID